MMNAVLEMIPDGYFLAKAKTIGSTDAELEAIGRGECQERVQELANAIYIAMERLNEMIPQGHG